MIRNFAEALLVIIIFTAAVSFDASAQKEVKHCIDLTTGEIYVVPANMPCPGTTSEY